MIINIAGRKIRNNFNAIPGRKPWMTDLMKLLHCKSYITL